MNSALPIFAHSIHRFAKMYVNMESSKRDLCFDRLPLYHDDIYGSIVHLCDGEPCSLRFRKLLSLTLMRVGKIFSQPLRYYYRVSPNSVLYAARQSRNSHHLFYKTAC
jgi:hypothetical protein